MGRIPDEAAAVIKEYVQTFHRFLPDMLEGMYLHGSIALDAYVPDSSDLDFVVMTKRRFTSEEVPVLETIHQVIAAKLQRPELDGCYIAREDFQGRGSNFYYNSGAVKEGNVYNPVAQWILAKRGIRVEGPEIIDLGICPEEDKLMLYVLENMNTYWAARLKMFKSLKTIPLPEVVRFEIEWSVLGILRQYYTLKEKAIISKLEAGEWGLNNLPHEHLPIIQEAVNIRKGEQANDFSSDKERMEAVISYMTFILEVCSKQHSIKK